MVASPNSDDFIDRSSYLEKDHGDKSMTCTHEDKEKVCFHIDFKGILAIYSTIKCCFRNSGLVPGLVTASTGSVGSDAFPTPALF